jgi:hypothetical protein
VRTTQTAMKPDITRSTYDPNSNFVRVVMQQGRLQLDADWNEQVDILHGLRRTLTSDVVGASGAPGDGFMITPTVDGKGLQIAAGRFYAGGWPLDNPAAVAVNRQPNYNDYALPTRDGDYIAYLDAFTRIVTPIEDPSLADPALDGLDTTVRSELVWQVKVGPTKELPPPVKPALMKVATEAGAVGTYSTLIRPAAGYTGLENLLYLVQIHDGGAPGTATLKWSRYNGSLAFRVLSIDGPRVRLASLGRTAARSLRPGDWIEFVNRESQLTGTVAPLNRIAQVDENAATITLDQPPPTPPGSPWMAVVRWDQKDDVTTAGVVAIKVAGDAIAIENGISVSFEKARDADALAFVSGDFWMIPARVNVGLLWPTDPAGHYVARPPDGVAHILAPLAICALNDGKWQTQDKRSSFLPLTDATGGGPASRVVYTNPRGYPIFAGVENVEEALDRVGDRARSIEQVIRVAPDGQFTTLAELAKALAAGSPADWRNDLIVVIGTEPGKHLHEETADASFMPWAADGRLTLTFVGESPETGLKLSRNFAISRQGTDGPGFAAVRFASLRLIVDSLNVLGNGIHIADVDTLRFDDCYLFGNATVGGGDYPAAVTTSGVRRIELCDTSCDVVGPMTGRAAANIVDTLFTAPLLAPMQSFLKTDDIVGELRSALLARAQPIVATLDGMTNDQRQAAGKKVESTVNTRLGGSLQPLLWDAFGRLGGAIAGYKTQANGFDRLPAVLIQLFEAMMWSRPLAAVMATDVPDAIVVDSCRIAGTLAYGVGPRFTSVFPDADVVGVWSQLDWSSASPDLKNILTSAGRTGAGSLAIVDSTLGSLTWGTPLVTSLVNQVAKFDATATPSGFFDAASIASSRLLGPLSCLTAESLRIESSEIVPAFLSDSDSAYAKLGFGQILIGSAAIVSGNIGRYRMSSPPRPAATAGVVAHDGSVDVVANTRLTVKTLAVPPT